MRAEALIPHEVISLMVEGASAARAWREHLGLTQMEAAGRPHKATRVKLATALGLDREQLVSA